MGNFNVDEDEVGVHFVVNTVNSSFLMVKVAVYIVVQKRGLQINVQLLIYQVVEQSKVIFNFVHIVLD